MIIKSLKNNISTLEDIRDELCHFNQKFPLEAIQATLSRQQEMTPILMGLLSEAALSYDYLHKDYSGHLYACYLLAYFREKHAFPLVLQIASLPEDGPDILLGDTITEDFHRIIGSVYDGNIQLLQQLIENEQAYIWSRKAALRALLVLVKAKQLERDEVIGYFKKLLSHPSFIEDEMALTHLITVAVDLYPQELYEEIKSAFANNKINTFLVNITEVNFILAKDKTTALNRYCYENPSYNLIHDVIKDMQSWACFYEGNKNKPRSHENMKLADMMLDFFDDSGITFPYQQRQYKTAKIERNEPCPCGSERKYKQCCLVEEAYSY